MGVFSKENATARSFRETQQQGNCSNPPICHDKRIYNDQKAIALLSGFEIHCRTCDSVTHVGRIAKVPGPEMAIQQAKAQLRIVNQCDEDTADKILMDSLNLWKKRSQKAWTIEVAPKLLEAYPELAELPAFSPS
jgi:hypothetical protein